MWIHICFTSSLAFLFLPEKRSCLSVCLSKAISKRYLFWKDCIRSFSVQTDSENREKRKMFILERLHSIFINSDPATDRLLPGLPPPCNLIESRSCPLLQVNLSTENTEAAPLNNTATLDHANHNR